ncbi:MAG: hypothetical protein IJW32_05285 [Clostridia bacterium]|nr:hypothetical protein [Clostridia bacterium]
MESTRKQGSILGGIFKFLGVLLAVIAVIVVAVYCFLRFSLGIDIFDIKNKLDLLNQSVDESKVITEVYDDEDAAQGFNILFGTNSVYENNGNGYVFNEDEFIASNLALDIKLTDEQFASIVNIFLNNIYDGSDSEDYANYIALKQVEFKNFNVNGTKTSVNVKFVAKIDFEKVKTTMLKDESGVVDFIAGLIPNNIYITSNFTIGVDSTNPTTYTVQSNSVILNQLSAQQSKETLQLLSKIAGSGILPENLNNTFATVLFGNNENKGFLDVLTGFSYFTFESDGTNIYLSITGE